MSWITRFHAVGYCRAPKMVLPTRIVVLPTSMACSKSPDIPMLSSTASSASPSPSHTRRRQSARHVKFSGREV